MPRYRGFKIEGGAFFFTLAIADPGATCWSVTSSAYLQATDVDARYKCGHDGLDERVI
jgi:hypothetical protein